MFSKMIAKFGFAIGCILALLVFAIACGISWIMTCGIVWLVTLCFGWTFSWSGATGVWILWTILLSIVNTIKG